VRTYRQYCPIARGAEIFAERWTPLIIRNLHLRCDTFGAILEGEPGLSHTLARSAAQATRAPMHRRVGTEASGARSPLAAHRVRPRAVRGLRDARRVGGPVARDRPREPRPIRRAVLDLQRTPPGTAPRATRGDPVRLHRVPAPRAVLATARARRDRDLQDLPRSRRRPTSPPKPKPSSNGTPASSPGHMRSATPASDSTARPG